MNATAILASLANPAYETVRDQIRASNLDWAERMLASYKTKLTAWVSEGDYWKDRKTTPSSRLWAWN